MQQIYFGQMPYYSASGCKTHQVYTHAHTHTACIPSRLVHTDICSQILQRPALWHSGLNHLLPSQHPLSSGLNPWVLHSQSSNANTPGEAGEVGLNI